MIKTSRVKTKKEQQKEQKKASKESDKVIKEMQKLEAKHIEELKFQKSQPIQLKKDKKALWGNVVDSTANKIISKLRIETSPEELIKTKPELWKEIIYQASIDVTIEILKTGLLPYDSFVDNVAQELSKSFEHNQIIHLNKEVYGYLEKFYPYDWKDLLKAGIFDRATLYSRINYRKEIITVIDIKSLDKYQSSLVKFREDITLENYEKKPFNRAIIFTPKAFSSSIKFIKNVPVYIDSFKIKSNLGKGNFVMFGYALVDLPVLLMTFSPGMHKAIFDIKIKPDAVIQGTIEILKKMVYYYRQESKTWQDEITNAKIETEKYIRRNRKLEDSIALDKDDDPQPFTDEPKVVYSTHPLLIALILIFGVITVISVIGAFF